MPTDVSLGYNCRFGSGCAFPCHCKGGVPCDSETGDCGDAGCDDGELGDPDDDKYVTPWTGPGCQIGKQTFLDFYIVENHYNTMNFV